MQLSQPPCLNKRFSGPLSWIVGLPRLRVQGSWLTVCAFRVGSLGEEAKEGRPAHTHSHAFNPT